MAVPLFGITGLLTLYGKLVSQYIPLFSPLYDVFTKVVWNAWGQGSFLEGPVSFTTIMNIFPKKSSH